MPCAPLCFFCQEGRTLSLVHHHHHIISRLTSRAATMSCVMHHRERRHLYANAATLESDFPCVCDETLLAWDNGEQHEEFVLSAKSSPRLSSGMPPFLIVCACACVFMRSHAGRDLLCNDIILFSSDTFSNAKNDKKANLHAVSARLIRARRKIVPTRLHALSAPQSDLDF